MTIESFALLIGFRCTFQIGKCGSARSSRSTRSARSTTKLMIETPSWRLAHEQYPVESKDEQKRSFLTDPLTHMSYGELGFGGADPVLSYIPLSRPKDAKSQNLGMEQFLLPTHRFCFQYLNCYQAIFSGEVHFPPTSLHSYLLHLHTWCVQIIWYPIKHPQLWLAPSTKKMHVSSLILPLNMVIFPYVFLVC